MDREGVAASSVVRSCQAFVDAYCSAARVAGQARADLVRRAKAHLPHLVLLAALEAARPLSSPIGEKWVFRELATQAGRHAAGGSWSEGIR
jgi:hypothetical protein